MSDSSNDAGDLSLSCSVSSIESKEIPPQFVRLSGFVVAHSLQEQSGDALSSLFRTKTAKLEADILHFKDAASFICALCDLIAHHTF